jgi:ATP-binding cassette, subfamily B, bacterial
MLRGLTDASPPPADRRQALRRLPGLVRTAFATVRKAAPRLLAVSTALQVVASALLVVQLLLAKVLITELLAASRTGGEAAWRDAVPALAGLVAVGAAAGLVAAAYAAVQRLIGEQVARHTIGRLVDVSTSVPLASFEDAGFYDELQRARAAAGLRPVQMVTGATNLVLGLVTSAAVVVALLALEPLLVPLVVVAGVPVLAASLLNARAAHTFEYAMTAQARERVHLLGLLMERQPAKEVRVFGTVRYLRGRFDALAAERIARAAEFLRTRFGVSAVAVLGGAVGTAIALGALVWLLATGRTDIATAATAVLAMQVLAGRLATVTGAVSTLAEAALFLDDLQRFLARADELPTERGGAPVPALERLEVEGLGFTYPGTSRPVLDDVSLELGRGEVVALVGENGSGKTTLVKLLSRLYEPDDGAIRWNGRDVGELDPEALRSAMTVLFQDYVQYHLSVTENIGLGRPDEPFDPGRVREAAQRAGAAGFVERLPGGFDQRLGRQFSGGAELSGGQWQRLALARAFYRDAELLVLDEPTAALDPRAEAELFEQVRALAAGRTVLLISHRFSSVRLADRIYVLEAGRVVEAGSHAELLELDGLYADLFRLQAAAYLGD